MPTEVTYASYLKLDELLTLQEPRTPEDDADLTTVLSEQFFIVSHQTCELWLKQILGDLAAVEGNFRTMTTAGLERSVDLLYRSGELLRLLHEQLMALERLPLEDFAQFRAYLGTASGAQSSQSHELERVLGSASRSGSLFLAFRAGLERIGADLEEIVGAGVEAGSFHRVVEAMLRVGNGYFRWKIGHVGLVMKMIGEQRGTAGTSGAAHLMDRATMPFTELHELRGKVHERRRQQAG
ncbi:MULTISPECIES: tryptophan 2,3-dioxygenase family protein [unclassified Streptomyces]|uniref:tryptophan 2,3-dioxygenase family protein n=1 Tax=unclassified Streptomyces TaxID=2593676 RepID=UPI002E0DC01A|nr:tryptophan 2,3-dioxygenase family protein [Streptomyces sp. NBC_01207]WTA17161.1 tryptophan 2,3-dioxygenase family protein [Streptomyces sp. NBC_00853]